MAAGEIDYDGFIDLVASSAPSTGYCNTMGTATTMNSLAEALGMQLPGSAAIPAPYRERGQMAYETGKRIVDMVREDLKPSDIMTREAFENAIVVNSAIGGSTNAPIHLNAIARHIGVELDDRRLADASATRSRCWSTCSRPANISARTTTMPAACRRWSAELIGAGADPRGRDDRATARPSARTAAASHLGREGHPPVRRAAEASMPASSISRATCSTRRS